MTAAKKMRVAMVGVGGFGGYRGDRMRETGLFEIVAAYDINEQNLTAACAQDGCKPARSFDELVNTAGIEGLIIATGGKFHAEEALAAMDKGLHVFVEKPLCSTPQEMQALLAAQKRTGVVVGVGHGDHSNDAKSRRIKEMIAHGDFGTVATFEKTTAHSGGLEIKPGDWRGDPEKNPGGMLFQCGVHALHELMFYFGPIDRVSAMMRYDVHTTLTADVAHCILHFESGLIGTLSAYHVTAYRHTFHLFGTQMNLYIDEHAYGDPSYYAVQYRKRNVMEPHEPIKFEGPSDPCGNLKSFVKCVREGGEPYPSLRDGALAVAVVFAAEDAAKAGKTVAVPKI